MNPRQFVVILQLSLPTSRTHVFSDMTNTCTLFCRKARKFAACNGNGASFNTRILARCQRLGCVLGHLKILQLMEDDRSVSGPEFTNSSSPIDKFQVCIRGEDNDHSY